jgi:hypothetical protein
VFRRVVLATAVLALPSVARAAHIDRVEAKGLGTTSVETITELLPRDAPAEFTDDELREFERRVRNLALFDDVRVSIVGGVLHIDVRRKENVEPELDFATGKTPRDTEVAIGALHHDIDGKATTFGIGAGYAERFAQFELGIAQHTYRARKWAYEAIGYYGGSAFRFEDSENDWVRGRLGGELEVKPPYWYATPFHLHASINAYAEKSVFARGGSAPPNGVSVAPWLEVYWDRWTFHDLVPHGLVCGLRLAPGVFLGPNTPRHLVRFDCIAGIALGERTVLAARGVVEGVNAGNVNHSLLLGSQEGVRGLPDTLFRNRAHAYANVELRHAIDLGKRWFLQPAAFVDVARFQSMDLRGNVREWRSALAVGGGVRVLPTALIDTLLRVDVSRLLIDQPSWFLQVGIEQYF